MKRSVLRSICTFLSCLLLVGLLAGGVVAMAEEATSGRCGQSLTWHFDPETGVLTIEGDGGMWDYDNVKQLPWFRYAGNIKEIILKKGVTSIGTNAFAGCAVEKVEFPETLQTIGKKAFYECKNLTQVDLSKTQVTAVAQKAFSKCDKLKTETVKLPETVQSVAPNAFDKEVTVTVEPPVVEPPVQPPVKPPVEPPVETPQEPALPYTWTETDSYGCKFVLTRQVDGSVTVIGYEKDGTEYFRSVRTYGENGKVHEEVVFVENGMSYVEDRIENEKGETVQFQRQKFDSQKKLFSKVVGGRKDNIEYISEYRPDDTLYYKGTTIFNEDGTSTEKSEEYDADGITLNRTQDWLLDKDRNLIKGTYTAIHNGGATVTTGTIVSNGDGTVTDTFEQTMKGTNPHDPKYAKGTNVENILNGDLLRGEIYVYDSNNNLLDKTIGAGKRNEDGSYVYEYSSYNAEDQKKSDCTQQTNADGSSREIRTQYGQDGQVLSTYDKLLDENRQMIKTTYTASGYTQKGHYIESGTVERDKDGIHTSHCTRTWDDGVKMESVRTQDEKSELTDSKDTYYDSKGSFVRKEVVKSHHNENGEVVSYVERFTEDDRKTGEYEKTEHLDGTVTQHEKSLDENGDVLKEFHSQRDADGKIRNVTVTDMKTGERTETTYDADGKGHTKVYDKDNNLVEEYDTTLLPPGSVPSNREDGTKENTEKENLDNKLDAENKPAGEGNTENKPAGEGNTENKPAGEGNTENKPAGEGNAENKPAGEGNTENKPAGKDNAENKPAGEGNTENKPDEKGDTENKPDSKGDTENKSDEKGDDKGTNTPGNTDGSKGNTVKDNTDAVPPMKTPNADTADKKEQPMENAAEKPAKNPETPAEEQQKRSI